MSRIATAASRTILKQRVSDPMSGFFVLRRSVLTATVRGLSAVGFKILLDILATSDKPLRVVEVPYHFRERFAGESKLDEAVIWEYGMLLADKLVGRVVPVRFLAFSIVGGLAARDAARRPCAMGHSRGRSPNPRGAASSGRGQT
jgi:dolichol-phosphate mannosyltransferase